MTYAIIETGGKQLRVEPGRFYDIELLSAQPDEKVTIESVLLVQHNGEVTIGQPLVAGAKVEGTVMRHLRGRKVLVYKMKPKKKTRKKRGHRQEITRLLIDSISLNGSVLIAEETTASEASVEEALAPQEATEASVEEALAPQETTEASVEEAPAPQETTEASAEEAPAPQEATEASVEEAPAPQEATEASVEEAPAPQEATETPGGENPPPENTAQY